MLDRSQLKSLEKQLGYRFHNKKLIITALTHSSYTNDIDQNAENYERFEFFGDSVLQLCVSEILFHGTDIREEGRLTKIRAILVCEETLSKCAANLGLNDKIIVSYGARQNEEHNRPSILADVVEAIIAAIYLDSGYSKAKRFINKILKEYIPLALSGNLMSDYKSALQEYAQSKRNGPVEYKLTRQTGPVHSLIFEYTVYLKNKRMGSGTGKTKKEAQQMAAKQTLEKLNVDMK